MDSVEKRLGDIAEIMTGVTGFSDMGRYSYQVIQPNSFTDTGALETVELQTREEEISTQQRLTPGDILVKRLNPSFVYVATPASAGMVASQNLLIVRPSPAVDSLYLGFWLEQKEVMGQVEHVIGSSAAIKAVSVRKLAEVTVPIVPIADQRRIGAVWQLSRRRKQLLQDYLAENDRMVSILASKILNMGGNRT